MEATTQQRISLSEMRANRRARAHVMAGKYRGGATLQEIGDYYGITRERVRQLLVEIGVDAKDGGQAKRTADKQRCAQQRKELRYLRKYGMGVDDFNAVQRGQPLSRGPYKAFIRQKANSLRRGIEWRLTFAEWWLVWSESGKYAQRGRAKDKYVMARHSDSGAYDMGNVKIILAGQNNSEYIRRYWKQVQAGIRSRPVKTHCKRGHEFTPENTYISSNGRICKTCDRERQRRYRQRRREGQCHQSKS